MSANAELGLPEPTGVFSLKLADGKDYNLYPLSINAYRDVIKQSDAIEDEAEQGTLFLHAVLWQALLPEHPGMTLEQASRLVPASWLYLKADGLQKLFAALDVGADVSEEPIEADPTEPTTSKPA